MKTSLKKQVISSIFQGIVFAVIYFIMDYSGFISYLCKLFSVEETKWSFMSYVFLAEFWIIWSLIKNNKSGAGEKISNKQLLGIMLASIPFGVIFGFAHYFFSGQKISANVATGYICLSMTFVILMLIYSMFKSSESKREQPLQ